MPPSMYRDGGEAYLDAARRSAVYDERGVLQSQGTYVGMAFWSTRSAGRLIKSSHGQRAWVPALGDLVQRADDSSYSVGSCHRRVLVRCP